MVNGKRTPFYLASRSILDVCVKSVVKIVFRVIQETLHSIVDLRLVAALFDCCQQEYFIVNLVNLQSGCIAAHQLDLDRAAHSRSNFEPLNIPHKQQSVAPKLGRK